MALRPRRATRGAWPGEGGAPRRERERWGIRSARPYQREAQPWDLAPRTSAEAQRAAPSSAWILLWDLAWEAFKRARREPATAASCPSWLGLGGSGRGGGGKPSSGAGCWGDSAVGAGPGAPRPNSVFAPAQRSAAKKSVWGEAAQPSPEPCAPTRWKLCRHKARSRHGLLRMIAVNCHEYSAYVFVFSE